MSDTLRASPSPITREAIARATRPMSQSDRVNAVAKNSTAKELQKLQDLLDPSIVSRGMIAPWGRDAQGVGQWAVPGIVAGAMKALDQTGEAMRLPPGTSPDHPAYKGVFDVAGAINMPALLRKGATSTLGMNLWHGGPNKWAAEPGFPQGRPRLDKMGSGEGAQAYGHGFYSAEKRAVADDYNKKLTGMRLSSAKRQLDKSDGDVDAAILKANQEIKRLLSIPDEMLGGNTRMRDGQIRINEEKIQELSKLKQSGEFSEGSLYKIDIPDEDVAKYIDLDAPLSEQKEIIEKLKTVVNNPNDPNNPYTYEIIKQIDEVLKNPNATGEKILEILGNDKITAEFLRKAGIPGNRYFDGMSSRFASEIDKLIKKHGSREAALDHAKSSLADAKKMLKNNSSIPTDMGQKLVNRWAEEIKLLNTPPQTRNYVTWDQDVLDRAKVLQRNEEIYNKSNIETTKRGNVLEINKIETPKDFQGKGLADLELQKLIEQADADGITLALTPSNAFGANKTRLVKWYKRNGFVPNKGRNKDFTTRESMIRYPVTKRNEEIYKQLEKSGVPFT